MYTLTEKDLSKCAREAKYAAQDMAYVMTTYTTVQITKEYHARLARLASKNKRTISGQLEWLIDQETKGQDKDMYTKGQKVRLTRDLLHTRTIYANAEVTPGETHKILSAGTVLTVEYAEDTGSGLSYNCQRNGRWYDIPADALEAV